MLEIKRSNAKSIYIHIPFCKRKCNYCAFVSFNDIQNYEAAYIQSLIKEIENFSCNNKIETIYFGGGTPNLLSIKSFEKIFTALHNNFIFDDNIEITIECNPKISDLTYMKNLKTLGINRVSIGAQSFNDKILKELNRIHTTKDTLELIENIHRAEIKNYSLDLMYGIFNQTINDVNNDIKELLKIAPPHISTYALKIEEGTPFFKYDKTNLPNEDICAEMYTLICDKLQHNNYNHYEVSNFAKNNFKSRHNLTYWKAKEYYGFGVASHGYCNGIRYKHTNDLEEYIKNPLEHTIISKNAKEDLFEEYIMLRLRLSDGINFDKIKENFNIDLYSKKEDKILDFIKYGYAKLEANNLTLTTKGFLISNYIIGELLS